MSESGTKSRSGVSLSITERRTPEGAALAELCERILIDGELDRRELYELVEWMAAHRSSDLPAVDFLGPIIDRIVADGEVTDAERDELRRSLEGVLHPAARERIKAVKRSAAAADRAARKEAKTRETEARQLAKAAERAERDRDREIQGFDFMLVGVRGSEIQSRIRHGVRDGVEVTLERDPSHGRSTSGTTVRVLLMSGEAIGYVPAEDAIDLAPLLDSGHLYMAQVKKILGYRSRIPVVVVSIRRPECRLPGLRTAMQGGAKSRASEHTRFSNRDWAFLLGALAGVWIIGWIAWRILRWLFTAFA